MIGMEYLKGNRGERIRYRKSWGGEKKSELKEVVVGGMEVHQGVARNPGWRRLQKVYENDSNPES